MGVKVLCGTVKNFPKSLVRTKAVWYDLDMKKILLAVVVFAAIPAASFAYDTMPPEVHVFDRKLKQTSSFTALDGKFDGGSDIALGDVDGDGKDEIVIGAGKDGGPLVQIIEADGTLIKQWYAYDEGLRTGIKVAVGDLNDDGKAEIVTGTGPGGGPFVRVFNMSGELQFGNGFFAFDKNFRGGCDVTVGDFDGDGVNELAVSTGPGESPVVREFSKKGKFLGPEFHPFAKDNKGGIVLATANVDGGTDDELVMGIASAGEDWVKVYKHAGQVLGEWNAFPGLVTGVTLGAADIDNDGVDEIAVAPRQNAGPFVQWFEGHGTKLRKGVFAYPKDFRGGLNLAGGDLDGNGKAEVVTVPGKNRSQGRADLVRYIETDLSDQKTRVYEYGELVREFSVSTGIARYATPTGTFRVQQKIFMKDYKWNYGEGHPDNYDIKDVKWNLRYDGPFHLHYAFWHNNFGHVMSHGCTNIDAVNAEWIYNWARVGDPVIVVQ